MTITREQIMSMSNKEINDLITHEVMGFERDWSTSMDAAWEVVDKLTGDKWMLHPLENRLNKDSELNGYGCCFFERWEGISRTAYAPEAPLAICRAALLTLIKEV